ncbi:MAG: gliding motility-associated C-terminal domain-containing protein, partial [Flavobacteriales bacterium]|nr:gliding motility-associated C-terminal domain-containing protein [Flavobacteriales bacterium]
GYYGQANSGQFIRKFDANLGTIEWTTTIGTGSGEIDISPTAFLVSDCYQIYFSGWGGQTNGYCGSAYTCYAWNSTTVGMPVTGDATQPTTDGSDFYLCVLSPDAAGLSYGSYLGGDISNEHVDGGTSRFDKDGQVYQAVCAGCGGNSDFPTSPGAWSADNLSSNCNIAVFKFDLGGVHAELEIDGPPQVCEGSSVPLINESTGATDYFWMFGDSTTSTEFQPSHVYETPGTYTIVLIATDDTECLVPDTASIEIEVLPGVNPTIDPVDPACQGVPTQLNAYGTDNLYWVYDFTLSDTSIPNPTVAPDESQFYCVVDSNACEVDTVCIWVELFIPDTAVSPDAEICIGGNVNLYATGGLSVEWWPATGLDNPFSPTVNAAPEETIIYTVTIYTEYGCEVSEEVTVTVYEDPPGGNVFPDLNMCVGNNVLVSASQGSSWSWEPALWVEDPHLQQTMVFPPDTTTFIVTIVNPCGSGQDQVTVNVIDPLAEAFGGGDICLGDSALAWATGGVEYQWSPPSFAHPFNEAITQLSPFEDMLFTVTVTDEYGCADQAEVFVNVLPQPYVDAGPNQYVNFPDAAPLFGTADGETFYWEPPLYINCTDCINPVVTPPQSMYYYLTAGGQNGCTATDSVWVEIYFPLWVPNTITPNNDGINDYFRAYGENIRGYHLWILDRWGIEIFETEDIEEVWDGGINGYYVQNDTYVWIIEYLTVDRTVRIKGHVNVVR